MQALFYAIPIIYPVSMVAATSEFAAKIILLNPIAQTIQDIRYCLITKESITSWSYLHNPILALIPLIITVIMLIVGALVFRKKSRYFAEEV